MMKVHLISTEGDKNFKGTNDRGQTMSFSGSKEGVSPMEATLMASAACSSIDIELILKKMRQPLIKIEVQASANRAETEPKVFTDIHLHYVIHGDVKEDKVQKAIDMSMNQFCSVSIMLAKAAPITTSYEII